MLGDEEMLVVYKGYEKKYLDVKYDPITKEELSKDIKIIIYLEFIFFFIQ